jgi:undecaprenyl-diphosphatase
MLEQIILGALQGIAEWLPISSEGVIVLTVKNFFDNGQNLETIVRQALFLHLGTFLAVLIYFRKDVIALVKALFQYRLAKSETKKVLIFLIVATLLSGFFGFILLKFLLGLEQELVLSAKVITLLIGFLLVLTGVLQIKVKIGGYKKAGDLTFKDGILLGLIQGLSVLPGFSRSGLTVSAFLLKRFDKFDALKLSFLMSLPIVLGGNIILNFNDWIFSKEAIWGLVFSFIFGLITIGLLLKLAKKINFGWFAFLFGILVVVSVFI